MIQLPTYRRRLIAAFSLALLPAAGSRADLSPRYGDAAPAAPAGTPRVVSLDDLIVAALNSNLDLKASRIDPKIALEKVREEEGAFDPVLGLTSYDQYEQHMQDSFELLSDGSAPSQTYWGRTFHNEASITGKLPGGTQYQLGTVIEQATNTYTLQPDSFSLTNGGSITRYPTEYTSTTTLTVTQPLLKDFGFDASLAQVHMKQSALSESRYDFRNEVTKVIADVMGAYYDMVGFQEVVKVKAETVGQAQKLVDEAQRSYDEGRRSELDVAVAKEHLSDARQDLLLYEDGLTQSRNKLRELVTETFPIDDPDWSVDGSRLLHELPDLHRDRLLVEMLENNPGYLATLEKTRQEDVKIAYAKNQIWPSVDLKGSVGFNGLAGNWDQAYDYNKGPIALASGPTWSAGVIVQVPFTGRTARAQLSEARAEKAQALLNLKEKENELLRDFSTSFKVIHTAVERAVLAHETVLYAQQTLEAVNRRMETGVATSSDVVQAQVDLGDARRKEVAVYVELNKGLTDLYTLTGTLPERMHVAVEGDNF